ncbi:MAG: PilZ domain-containing protein, partial [Candidatus Omnitrophota bacterium]
MKKIRERLTERRKYIRLKTPVSMTYTITDTGNACHTITKDISAEGLRFETKNKAVKVGQVLELKLGICGAANPVHAKGLIVWKKKISLEDASPYDVGVELTEIEEDNKNT